MTAAARPRRRAVPWRWLVLALALVAAGLYFLVLRPRSIESADAIAPTQETTEVAQQDFRVSVTGPGTLEPARSVALQAKVSGTVLSAPKIGNRVVKGQLLVRLDPTSFQRALDNNRLALEKARSQLAGLRSTQAESQASQGQSINAAGLSVASARRDLATADAALRSAQSLFEVGGASAQSVTDARDARAKAAGALESAQLGLRAAQQALSLKGGSNAQDLRNSQLAVSQAELSLQGSQADLAATKVYAPFAGVISAVTAQVGQPSPSGAGGLVTLVEDATVTLPVQVDETEIANVKVGQRADVTLDAVPDRTFQGKVVSVSPTAVVSNNIPIFTVTVGLDNADLVLKPGMSAEAEIVSREVPGALLVPRRAVETVRRRAYVNVLGEDGKTVESRRVTLVEGADDGTNAVVSDGLRAGETVVLPTRQTATGTGTGRQGGVRIPGLGFGGGGGR